MLRYLEPLHTQTKISCLPQLLYLSGIQMHTQKLHNLKTYKQTKTTTAVAVTITSVEEKKVK